MLLPCQNLLVLALVTAFLQTPPPLPHSHPRSCMARTGKSRTALRFLIPQRHRNPTSLPLALLTGHCHMALGAWSEALSEYLHAYRRVVG